MGDHLRGFRVVVDVVVAVLPLPRARCLLERALLTAGGEELLRDPHFMRGCWTRAGGRRGGGGEDDDDLASWAWRG